MPLISTRGAASAQGFGEFAQSAAPVYIEDVFSTYLYTGNSSTQTITNGIDLSGKGGLTWFKGRDVAAGHLLFDSARGVTKYLISNLTNAEATSGAGERLTAYNSNGFSLGTDPGSAINASGYTYASWSFRKQAKFFDVVTYTGNGSNRTISHNLGSVPGCIIVKRTDTTADWQVYHRSLANTEYLVLNTTAAKATGATRWNSTTPTSTVFSLGTDTTVNANGGTYVAYIFAHDAGGFGLSGTDNVISCGSYTTDSSGNGSVTLGYEPQWVFVKASSTTSDWYLLDTMRGMSNANPAENARLYANTSGAEASTGGTSGIVPTATGFNHLGYIAANATFIYIAIRRGPMKVPTSGTSVFVPVNYTGNGSSQTITTGITSDWVLSKSKSNIEQSIGTTRLSGFSRVLTTTNNQAEVYIDPTYFVTAMNNTAYNLGSGDGNSNTYTYTSWNFRRAPGFFDVVCYTGTGSARTVAHNLGAVPELMIVKDRPTAGNGRVYTESGGAGVYLRLFSTSSDSGNTATTTIWNNTAPTSSVFSVGASSESNFNARTYVAYLFGTVAGVSKVGSYTGTGATQTINCGFSSGSRFVLIKKSTSTAPDRNWYVWDSARGITSGNDPYLLLNTTDAEVTSTDYINTAASGFQIVTSDDAVNASGVTYIFLAIA